MDPRIDPEEYVATSDPIIQVAAGFDETQTVVDDAADAWLT